VKRADVERANAMFSLLYGEDRAFSVRDVLEFEVEDPYDVVLCCGGLYHMGDPEAVLRACQAWGRRFLVLQTVVSLDHGEDPDYFEAPAPGLERGSRFSAGYLEGMLQRAGWEVLDHHRNTNPGCEQARDGGSVFALCRPAAEGPGGSMTTVRSPLHRLRSWIRPRTPVPRHGEGFAAARR